MKPTAAESRYIGMIAQMRCVVCRRLGMVQETTTEAHHIAEGSGKRSGFATAPLCSEHHRGKSGLHGMGAKAFCALYRPLGDTEWGLLVWVNQDMESAGLRVVA